MPRIFTTKEELRSIEPAKNPYLDPIIQFSCAEILLLNTVFIEINRHVIIQLVEGKDVVTARCVFVLDTKQKDFSNFCTLNEELWKITYNALYFKEEPLCNE